MGSFTLNGKVNQLSRDGDDAGIDQDKTVATGWVGQLSCNYPKGAALPDGYDIDYLDVRTVTLLSDGSITEDGVTPGISLEAHNPALFATPLQWTLKAGPVTLASGMSIRPKPITFNAPLAGTAATLGGVTPVVSIPLLPAPGAVPWGAVSGKPAVVVAGENQAEVWGILGTVPTGNLPSYVDDVLEYSGLAAFPVTGMTGKIYVAIDTGAQYRWSGSSYIWIGGPDTGYDVILLAGQSNMQGADNTKDTAIDVADPRIFEWPNSGANINTIFPAVDPLHHVPGTSSQVGPGVAFAKWYASQIAPGRKVLLVPAAYYGTGFENSDYPARWKVGRVQGGEINLYENAITKTNAAMAAAGPGARVAAILWCQGEADGSTPQATYQADLLELIDGFRTRVTGAANAPFVILSMVPEQIAGGNPGRVTINNVHVDTPNLREFCGYAYGLPGHGVGSGAIHYDAAAQRWNGSVALPAAYRRALGNKMGTAPNAVTNVRVIQDVTVNTSANVEWDQALGRATDYTVQYRTAEGEVWSTLTRTRSLATSAQITGIGLGNYVEARVITVNEAGVSLPSASARVAMLPTPLIAINQTAPDTVTVTTAQVLGSTSYRFDYKLTAGSTWTIGTTQTGLVGTISGLTSAPYDFRVVAFTVIGAAVVAATSFALSTMPINMATLATAIGQAYGMRKVIQGYSGAAIRVRRSTDNTELDISFSGNNLDIVSLLNFTGAGNGFVTTLYDQSGNARHMLQATAAAQPKISAGGVLISNNGRAALDFDGVDDYMERNAAELWSSGAATVCGVASGTPNANVQEAVLAEGGTGSNNARYFINKAANGKFGFNVIGDVSGSDVLTQDLTDAADAATFGTTPTQWSMVDSGTNISRYRGGTALLANGSQISPTYSRSGKTLTLNRQSIGALHRLAVGSFAAIRLSELVIFNAAASTADRQTVEANQRAFYGTPAGL